MQCGLGRCIIELNTCEDKEKYREIVLWGCLNNLSYDTQVEGTRAEYVYELIVAYHDDEYFLMPLIDKFLKSPIKDYRSFAHFCDLLCCFAWAGHESAAAALHNKYDELYPRLLKKRKTDRYDFDRDNYERVSIAVASLEGIEAFIKIATDMGNLFLQNPNYDGFDFEWFYVCFKNRTGERKLVRIIERESKKSAAVKAFYDYIRQEQERTKRLLEERNDNREDERNAEDIIELAQNNGLEYLDCMRFRRTADDDQKLLLAKAIIEEPDLDKKAQMLNAFYRDDEGFPLSPEEIISYTKLDNEKLSENAFDAIAYSKDIAVREYAIQLLQSGQKLVQAIRMLIMNYQMQDKDLLLSSLDKLRVNYTDEDDWHSVVRSILDAFGRKDKLPKECLLFIYNKSLCSFCREYAVTELAKRRWLSDDLKAECALDSNFNIRDYAAKHFKNRT